MTMKRNFNAVRNLILIIFINLQTSNMQEIGYAILKGKGGILFPLQAYHFRIKVFNDCKNATTTYVDMKKVPYINKY